MDLTNIKTINDLITFGNNGDFSIDKLGIFKKNIETDTVYLDTLVYSKYMNEIYPYLHKIKYSDSVEVSKYAYRPDLLSMDVYGTPLLYHFILLSNNTCQHLFNKEYVYLATRKDLEYIFQRIMEKESPNIKLNRLDVMS